MKRTLKALRDMRYGTRRLKAGEEFEASGQHAKVLVAVGRAAVVAVTPAKPLMESFTQRVTAAKAYDASEADELAAARAEYQEKVGRRPFHGWDAAELRKRIADAS